MAGLCSAGGGNRQEVGGAGVGAARVVEGKRRSETRWGREGQHGDGRLDSK